MVWKWVLLIVIVIIIGLIVTYIVLQERDKCTDWANLRCDYDSGCLQQRRICGGSPEMRCIPAMGCSACPTPWPENSLGTLTISIDGITNFVQLAPRDARYDLFLTNDSQQFLVNFTRDDQDIFTQVGNDRYYMTRQGNNIVVIPNAVQNLRSWIYECGIIANPSRSVMVGLFKTQSPDGETVNALRTIPYDPNNFIPWVFKPLFEEIEPPLLDIQQPMN